MNLYIKNKNGITLQTQNKYCEEDISVAIETEELNVTPNTTKQTYEGLYSNVEVAGDSNLQSGNIKSGTTIFGIEGSYEGTDTTDGTATENDILDGKVAYSSNGKITGTIQEYDGAYTGEASTTSEMEKSFRNVINASGYGAGVKKLPTGLTGIRDYAFYNCVFLPLSELPEGITLIGNYAFYKCREITLTKLPEGVTTIGSRAFSECFKLALTKLPSGLTSIETYAFYKCSQLDLTELPVGLTSIPQQAFGSCTGLTELTCLGNITSIGSSSFNGCTNLVKFVLPNVESVPTLNNKSAFSSTPIENGTGYIYVPDSLVDSFKTATNWSTYANQIKGISEMEG